MIKAMKGDIQITELDYIWLCNLINSARDKQSAELKNIEVLGSEIRRAKKVDSKEITSEFVTMNSLIEVTDLDKEIKMIIKLVYPEDADFKKGFISILSPLGSALLGYKAEDIISFEVPKGIKEIRINKIIYQPEVNGEYTV
ncbi:MAG: GreA/GreB family elongation factor [Bacteroidales bacterium]|nr:GreA/GreB family elongation factor [Bacteroidales bacterium]